jgi:hypothetical protein
MVFMCRCLPCTVRGFKPPCPAMHQGLHRPIWTLQSSAESPSRPPLLPLRCLERCVCVLVALLSLNAAALGQGVPNPGDPGQTPPVTNGSAPPVTGQRPISIKRLIPNIASDQKRIWLFPVQVARGRHWIPTLSVIAVTVGLIASDPETAPYFRHTHTFQGFNSIFNANATATGIVLAPVSLYIAGLLCRDSYAKKTTLLAIEALVDTDFVTTAMKDVDRRIEPRSVPPNGDFGDTWFKDKVSILGGYGSFPSGHAIAAFSVATIMARRYGRQHRWVPIAAYGAATLVGFSRLTLSAHFPSDVFMGSALGYAISRFVVLRE